MSNKKSDKEGPRCGECGENHASGTPCKLGSPSIKSNPSTPKSCVFCNSTQFNTHTHCLECNGHHPNIPCSLPAKKFKTHNALPCKRCNGLYVDSAYNKNGNNSSRRYKQGYCRQCQKADSHERNYDGDTLEDKSNRLNNQGRRCAICNRRIFDDVGEKAKDRACTDHCHEDNCGAIRGELCNECNIGLGKFCDDPEILGSAIRYLNQHHKKCISSLPRPDFDKDEPTGSESDENEEKEKKDDKGKEKEKKND